MTDIFKSKETMPPGKEDTVSTAMDRSETPMSVPILSGERKWPNAVQNVIRPRRGHGY
jgi:hypothetical protein